MDGLSSYVESVRLLNFSEIVHAEPNLGDDLNQDIWPKLRPEILGFGNQWFAGMGTLLTEGIRRRLHMDEVIFFSSGAGYEIITEVPPKWTVVAVRGPLTASALHLPDRVAVTDGAALTPMAFDLDSLAREYLPDSRRAVLVPHMTTVGNHGDLLKSACITANIQLIDPRGNRGQLISEIAHAPLVITEALHGAIIADAYRVPWIRISTGVHINQFKWHDWAASMQVEPRSIAVPLVDVSVRLFQRLRGIRGVRKISSHRVSNAIADYRSAFGSSGTYLAHRLNDIIENAQPMLSSSRLLMQHQGELLYRLERL